MIKYHINLHHFLVFRQCAIRRINSKKSETKHQELWSDSDLGNVSLKDEWYMDGVCICDIGDTFHICSLV